VINGEISERISLILTTCLATSFSETSSMFAMFSRLNGCWPSLILKENIVDVKPLPYENITILWPAWTSQKDREKIHQHRLHDLVKTEETL
jgi:hypothetical protein